ncbi:MAG: L-seryl-tRNA(Sec) selenium transferase [Desulfobacterales bacterium]|nr:L-seryl-tRNA(Sec) selenium transferase [Desulfobacterales bacterium]
MAKAKSQKKKLVQINPDQQALLRKLPGVDHLMALTAEDVFFKDIPPVVVVNSIRRVIDNKRQAILNDDPSANNDSLSDPHLIDAVKHAAKNAMTPNLRNTINATGVVVHTNLGRSLLATEAVENLITIASRYSNLEYDLSIGKRGSRYSCVEDLICEISGAEAAMVVNNNAGAVLLCLETIARDKEVVVSRGELVEIGGSFRVPDVMAKSGGILREVGTTNRTHLRDYENAIAPNTGLLLKVHTSNYSVVGFTAEVSLPELVDLGAAHQLPVMEDLGSGTFIDFSKYGLLKEPTVQESVTAGADVITFSGDKLLGGPQSGIIVGKKEVIDRIKKNPITRALRIDKLTLAALESTLRLYRDEEKATRIIPTLRMIMLPLEEIQKRAQQLADALKKSGDARLHIQLIERSSKTGGGALPLMELPSLCVGVQIKGISPNALEKTMRSNDPPIIGRIEDDLFVMDPRTIRKDELSIIETAFENLIQKA